MNGKSELSGVRHLGALQEQSMNDVLKQAAEALRQAQAFIDGMRSDLHSLRATDWFPEGAHDAASSMSENMRLLGNACADFDCIGAGLAALESAQEHRPLPANPEKHIWQSWSPAGGYGYWDTEDKARGYCSADHEPVMFVPAQPLRELSEDGWLPIEMAPKDSTRILVSWPMREMDEDGFPVGPITSRHTLLTERNGGGWLEPDVLNASGSWFGDEDCFTAAPDLWQPLPNPPSAMRAARSAK